MNNSRVDICYRNLREIKEKKVLVQEQMKTGSGILYHYYLIRSPINNSTKQEQVAW